MAIELFPSDTRKQVVWLDQTPPADAKRIFEERGYRVDSCTGTQLHDPAYISALSAVIITQNDAKPLQITKDLESHARRLLDYDCQIILLWKLQVVSSLTNKLNDLHLPIAGLPDQEAEKLSAWQDPKDGDPTPPYARYYNVSDSRVPVRWHDVANSISAYRPGPAPNLALAPTVERIDEKGIRHKVVLSEEEKLLLRRAFHDCINLHLFSLEKGRSNANVYRACAELKGAVHGGRWQQPHFVKIDTRKNIRGEYKIYELNVDPYVPFHLGPHLDRGRCCLGATKGVIVGDYVEESESLSYCAGDGRAAAAIACLFDRTLLGWHRRAREEPKSLAAGLVRSFPKKIDPERIKKASKLGATKTLDDLRALFLRCTSTPVLAGPVHGDLHAKNVLVRATDAIVIDFFSHHDHYPLLCDAASLEASLLIEGFSDDGWNTKEWLESLKPLYDQPPLTYSVMKAGPQNPSAWFHACVQQIRRYARQWERGSGEQYATALALALLIKAAKDPGAPEPEATRRAAAYLFAEQILLLTFRTPAAPRLSVAAP